MKILTSLVISCVVAFTLTYTGSAQTPGAAGAEQQQPPKQQQQKKKAPSQGAGQEKGARKGKKMGPQDGSGPIHPPGTGGGKGSGQRGPRR